MSDDTLSMTTANQIIQPILAGFRDLSGEISEAIDALAIASNRPSPPPAVAESNLLSSPEFDKIAGALAKAQGQIKNPTKDAENPHFGKAYADLAGGIAAVRDALSANEITYIQPTRIRGGQIIVYTRLIHSSGQWIETEWPGCPVNAPPQAQGSGLTYARRYSLFSLVGIAGEDDDDDGNVAQGRTAPSPGRAADTARKATTRVEQPREPSLSKDSSETLLAKMLATLGACDTRESIVAWSEANHADKERLLELDRGLLVKAFTDKQKEVRKAAKKAEETPPAEAAPAAPESATA